MSRMTIAEFTDAIAIGVPELLLIGASKEKADSCYDSVTLLFS